MSNTLPTTSTQVNVPIGTSLDGVNDKYGIDSKRFNNEFERAMIRQDALAKYREDERLGILNNQIDDKAPALLDSTIGEIVSDMSSNLEDLAIDLVDGNFSVDIITGNRLLYIGLLAIGIGVLVWTFDAVLRD
jgi:hypothetical protein